MCRCDPNSLNRLVGVSYSDPNSLNRSVGVKLIGSKLVESVGWCKLFGFKLVGSVGRCKLFEFLRSLNQLVGVRYSDPSSLDWLVPNDVLPEIDS